MVFTFTLATALGAALPRWGLERRRDARGGGGRGGRRGGGSLLPFERWTARRPRAMALAAAGLLAVAVPGLPRLRVEDSWIDHFDPRSPLVTAARPFGAEVRGR